MPEPHVPPNGPSASPSGPDTPPGGSDLSPSGLGASLGELGASPGGLGELPSARLGGSRGSSGAARISPGGLREVGFANWTAAQIAGLVGGTTPPNLFLTLGRHRRLFRAWGRFGGRLMPRGILPRRETELVILRVAHLRDCAYEYEHHVRLGRRAGVDSGDVARIAEGPAAFGWTARERAVLTAVDHMHAHGDLDDPAWAGLRRHLSPRECIELCMLAAHYEMLATVITSLRIQPDPPRRRESR
ncbi:carboxymuconolactone decarboxylase family protein [Spirillospora sp. NPDC048911]|uniref:carboxymuconolactone decarboxylase family protein n=1 Tax=Spirillospora sp. NPDC048911 TaxID=3364527 RepID=UPI003711B3CA